MPLPSQRKILPVVLMTAILGISGFSFIDQVGSTATISISGTIITNSYTVATDEIHQMTRDTVIVAHDKITINGIIRGTSSGIGAPGANLVLIAANGITINGSVVAGHGGAGAWVTGALSASGGIGGRGGDLTIISQSGAVEITDQGRVIAGSGGPGGRAHVTTKLNTALKATGGRGADGGEISILAPQIVSEGIILGGSPGVGGAAFTFSGDAEGGQGGSPGLTRINSGGTPFILPNGNWTFDADSASNLAMQNQSYVWLADVAGSLPDYADFSLPSGMADCAPGSLSADTGQAGLFGVGGRGGFACSKGPEYTSPAGNGVHGAAETVLSPCTDGTNGLSGGLGRQSGNAMGGRGGAARYSQGGSGGDALIIGGPGQAAGNGGEGGDGFANGCDGGNGGNGGNGALQAAKTSTGGDGGAAICGAGGIGGKGDGISGAGGAKGLGGSGGSGAVSPGLTGADGTIGTGGTHGQYVQGTFGAQVTTPELCIFGGTENCIPRDGSGRIIPSELLGFEISLILHRCEFVPLQGTLETSWGQVNDTLFYKYRWFGTEIEAFSGHYSLSSWDAYPIDNGTNVSANSTQESATLRIAVMDHVPVGAPVVEVGAPMIAHEGHCPDETRDTVGQHIQSNNLPEEVAYGLEEGCDLADMDFDPKSPINVRIVGEATAAAIVDVAADAGEWWVHGAFGCGNKVRYLYLYDAGENKKVWVKNQYEVHTDYFCQTQTHVRIWDVTAYVPTPYPTILWGQAHYEHDHRSGPGVNHKVHSWDAARDKITNFYNDRQSWDGDTTSWIGGNPYDEICHDGASPTCFVNGEYWGNVWQVSESL